MKTRMILWALIMTLLLVITGCGGTNTQSSGLEEINVTLPFIPTGEVAFLYVAEDKGFYKDHGLKVNISRGYGSGEAAKQVGLGEFHFGQADTSSMISAIDNGIALKSIAMIAHKSPVGIFFLEESGIKTPKDLEGKRLGGTPTGGSTLMWPAFASANNIDTNKVDFITLAGDVQIPSLLKGELDAVVKFYQNFAPDMWSDNRQFGAFLYSDYGLDIYNLTMMASENTLQNKDLTKRFVDATLEGLKYSYLHPKETIDLFLKAVPEAGSSDRDLMINTHSLWINTLTGMVPTVAEHGLGWHDPQIMADTLKAGQDYLGISDSLNAEDLYTNEFAGSVKISKDERDQIEAGLKFYRDAISGSN